MTTAEREQMEKDNWASIGGSAYWSPPTDFDDLSQPAALEAVDSAPSDLLGE